MRALEVHHIGHAVLDLDAAVARYEQLFGARCEHREVVPEQGVEAASMLVGDDRIELLAALGEDTPVGRFLLKRGPGMHHIAYRVEGIQRALDDAAAAGAVRGDVNATRIVLPAIMCNAFAMTISGTHGRTADDAEELWDLMLHGISAQ